MPTDKNKLVLVNREQYLSNRYIYEDMIILKKMLLADLEIEPLATKKRKNISRQLSFIISRANKAIQNGYEIPKPLKKAMAQELSYFISGNAKGVGWSLVDLRKKAIKTQEIIDNPNKRIESAFSDGIQIDNIYNGFLDAIALKNNAIYLEDMDNKYYRKRRARIGYQYGFEIGMKKNKLVQRNFEEYFQGDMDIDISTPKKSLIKLGLWEKVRGIVEASKKSNPKKVKSA